MKKRAQKQYETAQEIEAEIDKLNEAKRNNLSEVVGLDKKIDALVVKMNKESDENKVQQIGWQIDALKIMRVGVDSRRPLLESKLLRLKKTHAAFHTVDMFGEQKTVLQK